MPREGDTDTSPIASGRDDATCPETLVQMATSRSPVNWSSSGRHR